jgi:hypothetical protein
MELKFEYHACKRPLLHSLLGQLNLILLYSHFLSIHFNIILPSMVKEVSYYEVCEPKLYMHHLFLHAFRT